MCVVSMVMEHQWEEWNKKYIQSPSVFISTPTTIQNFPSQAEIDEFHRLLERARKYDKEHNQPDCEIEEKREKLRKMADELGVEIDFV